MTSASTFSDSTQSEDGIIAHVEQADDPIAMLPERPFPHLDNHFQPHGNPGVVGEPLIVMTPQALLQIREHGTSNLQTELGGFLLGQAYQDKGRLHLKIEAALPALSDDHGPVHFTFTADSWATCHQRKEEQYPDLNIVGWYHTHPGLTAFYSSDDVVVHTAGFSLPWHVGYVVDPIKNQASFFGWVNDDLANLSGYYELSESGISNSATTWHYVETYVSRFADYEMAPVSPNQNQYPVSQSLITPREWAYVIGSLAAVLFFLLGGWVATLNQQVTQLEQVLLTQTGSNPVFVAEACPDPRLRMLSPLTGLAMAQGETVAILGTADLPGATRYRVEKRLASSESGWVLIGVTRFDQSLGTLVRWNTRNDVAGLYEVRLTAVDRQNIQLEGAPPCQIQVLLQ